ncbi:MAG: hypothetical protein AB1656_14585 [Candidatus Omnitrophota bacterium]
MNMGWNFLFVIVTASLLVCFTIAAFTGLVAYPPWLIETHFLFYWYSFIVRQLNLSFCDITKKNTDEGELRNWAEKTVTAYIVLSLLARFVLRQSILVSYIFLLIPVILLPMLFVQYILPRRRIRYDNNYYDAKTIKEAAMISAEAQAFLLRFNSCQTYVFHHAWRNEIATCLFLYRRRRKERPELYEDIALETAVHLKTQKNIEGWEKISRYLFQIIDDKSAVVEISRHRRMEELPMDEALNPIVWDQLESSFERYDSLREIPLAIAVNPTHYETA